MECKLLWPTTSAVCQSWAIYQSFKHSHSRQKFYRIEGEMKSFSKSYKCELRRGKYLNAFLSNECFCSFQSCLWVNLIFLSSFSRIPSLFTMMNRSRRKVRERNWFRRKRVKFELKLYQSWPCLMEEFNGYKTINFFIVHTNTNGIIQKRSKWL